MLPGMDADQARHVLAAARDSAADRQWQEIHHQLHEIHEQHILTGTDHGDAAYLLGLAAMGTGDWTGALTLLTEALSTAGHEYKAEAGKRIAEIQHHDAAAASESDQDVNEKESTVVLAAGDEAMARGDYDGALAHYTAVYNGHADAKPRAKGALGIANVLAHRDDLKQAKQYAEYVAGTGVAEAVAAANTLLAWIAAQEAALTAIADGTTINEYDLLKEAVNGAWFSRDYARARTILTSMSNNQQLGTVERAKVWLHLGLVESHLGDYTAARLNFDLAVSHGAAPTVEKAQRNLEKLDRHDHAALLLEEFED